MYMREYRGREYAKEKRKKYQNDPKNKLRQRDRQLRRNFGISLEDFNQMVEEQENACAICGKISDKTLHIDHSHATGRVRALLCTQCNSGLGFFFEDTDTLLKAIEYLKKYN